MLQRRLDTGMTATLQNMCPDNYGPPSTMGPAMISSGCSLKIGNFQVDQPLSSCVLRLFWLSRDLELSRIARIDASF